MTTKQIAPEFFAAHLRLPALRLLSHSWKDISYRYEGLTDSERALISRTDFDGLVALIRACGLDDSRDDRF